MSHGVEILGYVAGALTTLAFVPQVVRTWKTRSTTDISLGMFLIFSAGVLLWEIYGLCVSSGPVILANAVTLALSATVLGLKIKHG